MVDFKDLIEKLFQIYTEDAFNRYNGDYYLSTPSEDEGYINFCFSKDDEGCFIESGESEWYHPYFASDLVVERAKKVFNISCNEKRRCFVPIQSLEEDHVKDCVRRYGTFKTITSGDAILKGFIIDYKCEKIASKYSYCKNSFEEFIEEFIQSDKNWKMFESVEKQGDKFIAKTRFLDSNCQPICIDLLYDKKGVTVSYKIPCEEFKQTKTFEKLTTFFMDYFEEDNCVGGVFAYPESIRNIKDVLFGIVMTANGEMFLDIPFEEYNPNDEPNIFD